MHIKITDWLNGIHGTGGTNLSRLGYYVRINGGLEIKKVGRPGLIPEEAMDFVSMIQFAMGTMYGLDVDERREFFDTILKQVSGSKICVATENERRKLKL